jgi:hypothetical protein
MSDEEKQSQRRDVAPTVGDDVIAMSSGAGREDQHWVRNSLAALATAATLFAPIAFVTLHAVYAQFYQSFGLEPEDVGITSGQVLTTSLVAFGFAFVLWLAVWIGVFWQPAYAVMLTGVTKDADTPLSLGWTAAGLLPLLIGIPAAIDISGAYGVSAGEIFIAFLMPVTLIAAIAISRLRSSWAIRIRRRLRKLNIDWVLIIAAVAAVVLAGLVLVTDSEHFGAEQAQRVKRGEAVLTPELPLPAGYGGLRAVDIGVPVADVYWMVSRPPSVKPSDCLMYIGTSGGITFLWNVRAQALLRVPESTIVIVTSSRTTC